MKRPLWARSRHLRRNRPCPIYPNSDRKSGHSKREILAGDRHQLERWPQQALYGVRGDDGAPFRIGFVVLLDIVEGVEVVHHQAVRLRYGPARGVSQPVDALKSSAIAQMEPRDRIDRRASPVA